MKYLIDTNICIYIIKKKPEKVIKRFLECVPGDIGISSITVSELYYGIEKSSRYEQNLIALQEFLVPFEILNFTEKEGAVYGKIRNSLENKAQQMGQWIY